MLRLKNKQDEALICSKTTIHTRVEDFLCDDDFIRYVLDASSDTNTHWASYLSAAPQIRRAFMKARDILTHLDECDMLTAEQVARLKERIMNTVRMSAN